MRAAGDVVVIVTGIRVESSRQFPQLVGASGELGLPSRAAGDRAGRRIPTSSPMIAMTTRSSMSVKACFLLPAY